jgi:hypothetical protein
LEELPPRFTVLNNAGECLTSVWLCGRQEVRVPLPAKPDADTAFKLHIDVGRPADGVVGKRLTYRVFGCRCVP